VRVKSPDQIRETLNDKGMNRGLWFDSEMLRNCGQTFRVRRRIERLVDEHDGKMIELASDCVTLEGVVCSGEWSTQRWFCPRASTPTGGNAGSNVSNPPTRHGPPMGKPLQHDRWRCQDS
jgi:hypothetical protein